MSTPFEVTGQFGGFVFTDVGKRRMLLRCGPETRLLKVPRLLRRRIIGKFGPGESICVAGTQERDDETGVIKEVVSQVLPAANPASGAAESAPVPRLPAAAPCVIRVCAKKHCWRQGGRELWEVLDRQLDALGRPEHIKLKQVGCLDHCKHAPNLQCGHRVHSRCSSQEAEAIMARATNGAPRPSKVPAAS